MPETVKVRTYCGHYIGLWDLFTEPSECFWQAIVEVDAQEWKEGLCMVVCPKCYAELWQSDSHLELELDTDDNT